MIGFYKFQFFDVLKQYYCFFSEQFFLCQIFDAVRNYFLLFFEKIDRCCGSVKKMGSYNKVLETITSKFAEKECGKSFTASKSPQTNKIYMIYNMVDIIK